MSGNSALSRTQASRGTLTLAEERYLDNRDRANFTAALNRFFCADNMQQQFPCTCPPATTSSSASAPKTQTVPQPGTDLPPCYQDALNCPTSPPATNIPASSISSPSPISVLHMPDQLCPECLEEREKAAKLANQVTRVTSCSDFHLTSQPGQRVRF